MRKIIFIILIFISAVNINSQQYKLLRKIGNFRQATGFSITPGGFIFVADAYTNEITKLDTTGVIIRTIGGYGWYAEMFDYPADILATTLHVYVTDKNNNRIQMFDKDLNFLLDFNTKENEGRGFSFAYPVSCGISNQGDFYILDSDNLRVIKYDASGNFITAFGGIDAGDFVLEEPRKLSVSPDGDVFIIDKNEIKIFDPFGSPLSRISTQFIPENLNITFNYLVITSSKSLAFADLSLPELSLTYWELPHGLKSGMIIEGALIRNRLYILTLNAINIYAISRNKQIGY